MNTFRAPLANYEDFDLYGEKAGGGGEKGVAGKSKTVAGKTVDGKTVDGKTVDGKTVDGKTVDGKTVDGKRSAAPIKTSSVQGQGAAGRSGKSVGGKSVGGKSVGGKSVGGKSVGPLLTPVLHNIRHQALVSRLDGGLWLRVFGYLDLLSIVRWSMTCRRCQLQVHCAVLGLLKPLFALTEISTNLKLWRHTIEKLLLFDNRLVNRDRSTYRPLLKELSRNLPLGQVGVSAAQTTVCISFDDLPAKHIAYCHPTQPQRHTSSISYLVRDAKVFAETLTLGQFMLELRHNVRSTGVHLVSKSAPRARPPGNTPGNIPGWNNTSVFIADATEEEGELTFRHAAQGAGPLCLFEFLKAVIRCCVSREKGDALFRRVELLKNDNFQLHHRLWLQCTISWPLLNTNPPDQATLFMTVCDHYHWIL
ncbi:hypothetical protein GNI_165560 [Gregarina niphandrodes]|uniref:Uncharacterized protein n=1 Tax=Gregarina niphandrodes TaxID=110365 RepID=A0A023AY53_GRENI|nr:hypothetical protein GNI_165560 [Gregarina niphandrodes]EZG43581.1 hypothetical protein GNI_165560 [Gregarina niphandrodes]|eukprot:XP_011133189.1 hypothetical protein GNI_165560 [Gregarina niphandrodes]